MRRRGREPATRFALVKTRRRRERVSGARDLLTRKRRALVTELFRLAAPALDAREEVGREAAAAYAALLEAWTARDGDELRAAAWPGRELAVEIRRTETWGVEVAEVTDRPPVRRSLPARGTHPGATGPGAATAADAFERLVQLLLDAASREARLRRLGDALARTSRQLNTLEQRVLPEMEERIREIQRTLEEREREEHQRIRRVLGDRRGHPGSTR